MIVRENTEGFYSDRNMFQGIGEFMPDPDMALSVRKMSGVDETVHFPLPKGLRLE